jgi:hypothetical protein
MNSLNEKRRKTNEFDITDEHFENILKSPIGLNSLYEYIVGEGVNEQNFFGYLSLKYLVSEMEENTKTFKVKIKKWLEKYNFDGKENKIKIIKKELSEDKGEKLYKTQIKELFKEIESQIIVEYLFKFHKTMYFKDFIKKEEEFQKNSLTIFEKAEWILNNSFEWPRFLPENEPNYIARELLQKFLNLINSNEFLWDLAKLNLNIQGDKLISLNEFSIVKQMTVELSKILIKI